MNTPNQTAKPFAQWQEEEAAEGIDLRALAHAMWSYKWFILGVAAAVSVGTILWTLRQPRIYEAVCVIEYDPNQPRPLGDEVEDVMDLGNYWSSREYFSTQNRIIASRTVAERVVSKLGLHRDPDFNDIPPTHREAWKGNTIERTATMLQDRLTVEQEKNTRLVEIRVKDRSPERARLLANAIADSYIDKTLEDRMGSTVSALDWLSVQLDEAQKRLEESENALHRFKKENNILSTSLEDKQNIVANDIQHFSTSVTDARTRRIELEARVKQLRQAHESDPLTTEVALLANNATLAELRKQYWEKKGEYDSLALRYGKEHPEIKSRQAVLDSIVAQIRSEITNLIKGAEAELKEITAVESGLKGALNDSNQAGFALNLREIEYQRLNRQRENNAKLHGLLLERTTQTNLTKLIKVTPVRVVDRALRPVSPVSPNLHLNIGVGILSGILLGFGVALLLHRMDRRIRTVQDAEALGITILGIVPSISVDEDGPTRGNKKPNGSPGPKPPGSGSFNRDLVVHSHPMSSVAECCRTIRTNLMFMSPDDPVRTILVTSPGPQEGKSTVTVSMAIVMAQSGRSVLLIDTDLRRPRIHRAFGVSSAKGITSVLIGEASLDEAVQATQVPGVSVLPCGPIPPNPSELLHTESFRDLVKLANQKFDCVILDSPPLGAVTDAAIIAPQIQAAILVIHADHTSRDAVRSALRQIRDVGAALAGGVLNDVDPTDGRYGNGYSYYYRREGYYYTTTPEDDDTGDNAPDGPPAAEARH